MRAAAVAVPSTITRSPARQQLAEHLEKAKRASAAVDAARKPADRLLAAVEAAELNHRAAQGALADVDASEAAEMAAWARRATHDEPQPAPKATERDSARERVTEATRALVTCNTALADATAELATARSRSDALSVQITQFVLAVLVDCISGNGSVMQRLQSAFTELHTAEADAVSLVELLTAQGRDLRDHGHIDAAQLWFRAGEAAVAQYQAAGKPADHGPVPQRTDRWRRLIAALANDPDAVIDA
jgi:chromosome segregation ATPase